MKYFIPLLLSFLAFTQYSMAKEVSLQKKELPLSQLEKQNRTIVKMASEELSQTLPKKIDAYTVLTKIEGKDTTMIYHFEINTGTKSDETIQKEDKSRMQKAVTSGVCRSSKRFLDAGITIRYLYSSAKSKAELFHFDIHKKECK